MYTTLLPNLDERNMLSFQIGITEIQIEIFTGR
jgi:hypothetical protein